MGLEARGARAQTSSQTSTTSTSTATSTTTTTTTTARSARSRGTSTTRSNATSRASSPEREGAGKKEILTLALDTILRSSDHEHFSQRRASSDVSSAVAKCRRAVVISGAGISCSSGIPDFRSNDGLYSLVKDRYPDQFVTGKDSFSSGSFNAPETTSSFYTFIAELASSCLKAQPTRTHHFISRLHSKGKLSRSYTQNIDGLERRVGSESGGRGLGFKKTTTKNVEMHGDSGRVRCVSCMADFEAKLEWMESFKEGSAPWCPACEQRSAGRVERAARALPVGTLRPSIVLYDENHPLGEQIGDLQVFDLFRKPDSSLIMGTSLKVHGLKRVVREFAKAVHAKKGGSVVFINLTPPSKEWEDVIDIHIQGETDAWVERVEEEWKHLRPGDWESQTTSEAEVVKDPKSKTAGKPRAKGRVKKASQEPAEPVQSPTPRPSQSPHRHDSSSIGVWDTDLTPAPSSPLSSPPPSPILSPLTPSKRRANAIPSPKSDETILPAKKRVARPTAPVTGSPATPGRGNSFAGPGQDRNGEYEDVIAVAQLDSLDSRPAPKPKARRTKAATALAEGKENNRPNPILVKALPKLVRVPKARSARAGVTTSRRSGTVA